LLESELFGHRRGAFTDASRDRRGALSQAAAGTLFLDEIGEVSAAFQVKLLRFLEDRVVTPVGAEAGETIDVRVVAGTHRDVKGMVGEGLFREDLYYRLSGYVIRIPPLRERLSDLPALVAHFERLARRELGLPEMATVSAAVLGRLAGHTWPGNVRELAHVVRRALIDAGRLDDAAAVEQALREGAGPAAASSWSRPIGGEPLPATPPTLEEVERHHILTVLASAGGNQTVAARLLGIERKTLARKLKTAGGPAVQEGGGDER
jgi:DNA-binding NtrC family response regulator